MRRLYHFEMSVFSRRTRLALAHKGLEVELKEGREEPANLAEAHTLTPLRTMPVFVEEDGTVIGDSNAIARYLDLAYPERPLVPRAAAADALPIMAAVDVAMNALVDLGTRYFALRNDPAWSAIKDEHVTRGQLAIDFVAAKATRTHLAGDAWSAADIWVYAATAWVAAWPTRVKTSPLVAQMSTLGFKLPEELVAWSQQHASRPDVRSIYG